MCPEVTIFCINSSLAQENNLVCLSMFEANIFPGTQTDHLPEYLQHTLGFCTMYSICGFCEILSTMMEYRMIKYF